MSKEGFKKAIKFELEKNENVLFKKLEQCKINISEHIPPPEVAWEIKNSENNTFVMVGTNGNFSLVKGKAKSKKSFFINMAIASATGEDTLQNKLRSPLGKSQNHVIYFDTEQSKYHVQKAVKRVCRQINLDNPNNLTTYALRKMSPSDRLLMVEHAIENTPNLGFVVIDGIRDLITSINDEAESSHMASKLLKWTEEYNIHIVVVLHENPGSDKARGHIGTELTNKAETVIALEVDKTDDKISIVSAGFCRNEPFDPFAFEITDDGLPNIVQGYIVEIKSKRKGFDLITLSDEDKFQVLKDAFDHSINLKNGELVDEIKRIVDKKYRGGKGKGINKIKELIRESKDKGWLIQDGNRQPYELGKLSV